MTPSDRQAIASAIASIRYMADKLIALARRLGGRPETIVNVAVSREN